MAKKKEADGNVRNNKSKENHTGKMRRIVIQLMGCVFNVSRTRRNVSAAANRELKIIPFLRFGKYSGYQVGKTAIDNYIK